MKHPMKTLLCLLAILFFVPLMAIADEIVLEPDHGITPQPSAIFVHLSNSQAQAVTFTVEIYAIRFDKNGLGREQLISQHQLFLPAAENGVPSRRDLQIDEKFLTKVKIIAEKDSILPSAGFEYCVSTGNGQFVCGSSALFRDSQLIIPEPTTGSKHEFDRLGPTKTVSVTEEYAETAI